MPKISELPDVATVAGADYCPVVQAGPLTTRKATITQLQTFLATTFAPKASPTFTGVVTVPEGTTNAPGLVGNGSGASFGSTLISFGIGVVPVNQITLTDNITYRNGSAPTISGKRTDAPGSGAVNSVLFQGLNSSNIRSAALAAFYDATTGFGSWQCYVYDSGSIKYTFEVNNTGIAIKNNYGVSHNSNTIVTNAGHLKLRSYTVATLPSASGALGELAYASNARVSGEGAGAGTGGVVSSNNTVWKVAGTNVTAAA